MKKITVLLIALIAGAFAMQVNAESGKEPMRSSIYSSLPSGFQQAGESSIYYSIDRRESAGPGNQYGVSILGKIGDQYYSSTYGSSGLFSDNPGAGFIAAMQVNGGTASYMTSAGTTTIGGVSITPSVDGQGDVAARIVYTITNNNNTAAVVNVGAWADIYIGTNDYAPISRLNDHNGNTYALDLKESTDEGAPMLCVLFGQGVTGVTPVDDFWFGRYNNNYEPIEIVGNYDDQISNFWGGTSTDYYWMVENGSYDSGMGFCWKNRTIEAGETIELSFLISVGNIPFEEPIIPDDPEPGEDIFTYNIEDANCAEWNDYYAPHPIHVWGQYEHPYGQNGYLEYQVDDENTWHTMGELISGAEDGYEFNFNVTYNPNRATDHVIAVRFNDGLGNITPLTGLSLIDIRSIDVTITCQDEAVYNGQPHLFDVAIDRETITIGQEGQYVNPGTYHYYLYGAFADNTIGVKDCQFMIDKAQSIIDVDVPDNVQWDGNAHPATVTVVQGGDPVITYIEQITGATYTTAPVEVGIYTVIVTMPETPFYYGSTDAYGQFAIFTIETAVNEINAGTQDNGAWYTIDGRRVKAPTQPGIYIHNGKKYIVK